MAGEFTLSGYKAAATTYLSTELNSIVDGGNKLGASIDNSTNKYLYHDIEIYLASAAFTDANGYINVYLLPSVDGTNYAEGTDSIDPRSTNRRYRAMVRDATAAQYLVIRDVELVNGNFKYLFENNTGITIASSGNTFKYRPHNGAYT